MFRVQGFLVALYAVFCTQATFGEKSSGDANSTPGACVVSAITSFYNFRKQHCPKLPQVNGTGEHPCPSSVAPYCDADVSDAPMKAFRRTDGDVFMTQPLNLGARGFSGESFAALSHSCAVYHNSTYDLIQGHYASHEWIQSPWIFPANGSLVGLVHMEFHNQAYPPGIIPGVEPNLGIFSAVTLVASTDEGRSWQHQPSVENAAHLVAAIPVQWNHSLPLYGFRSPSNILEGRNSESGFYYASVTAGWGTPDPMPQHHGLCMMRTRDLTDAKAWRAWNGSAWTAQLGRSPYTSPPQVHENTSDAQCKVLSTTTYPSLLWSTHFNQYLLFGTVNGSDSHGWQFQLSDDLIHWSDPHVVAVPSGTIQPAGNARLHPAVPPLAGRFLLSTNASNPALYWQPTNGSTKNHVGSCTPCPGVGNACTQGVRVPPTYLDALATGPPFTCDLVMNNTGDSAYLYPSLLDPESPSRNFDSVGQRAKLFLVTSDCVGYNAQSASCSPFANGGVLVRDVVSVDVEFT